MECPFIKFVLDYWPLVLLAVIVWGIIDLIRWVIKVYNRLITLKHKVINAWHQIEVQLQRRYDLIENLVNAVKGYAKHEKEAFEKIAEARARAMGAKTPGEKAKAEGELTSVLKTLFAVAEAYPELKANTNFLQLQEELTSTENKVAYARQAYNDTVYMFNKAIELFPTNIIAGMFGFRPFEYFDVESEEVRRAPKVQF